LANRSSKTFTGLTLQWVGLALIEDASWRHGLVG
jgi:hypothetical protein